MRHTNTSIVDSSHDNADSSLLPIKLSNLPLRPCTTSLLQRRGFVTTKDVSDAGKGGMKNLADELGVTLKEALEVSREVEATYRTVLGIEVMGKIEAAPSVSAAEILRNHRNDRPIVTFCEQLDTMLGGGVAIGEITECSGEPGSGKTQLGMQIAVDARIPIEYGGVAGEAIYIDTEGSFAPSRCWSMAQALVTHIQSCATRKQRHGKTYASIPIIPPGFTVESILEGIHVFRCHDEAAQTATIMSLRTFIQDRQKLGTPIKVIIVDSIAFHFRSSENYKSRTRTLISMAAILSDLATNYSLAIFVINQMTTKIGISDDSDQVKGAVRSRLIPALGESWAHSTTSRLILSYAKVHAGARECRLVKSPHKPTGVAMFSVTADGIRDYSPFGKSETGSNKRPRPQACES